MSLFAFLIILSGNPVCTEPAVTEQLSAVIGQVQKSHPSAEEILAEVNLARTNPSQYAEYVREQKSRIYRTRRGGYILQKPTGNLSISEYGAWDIAINFLERQKPLQPLTMDDGLTKAAAYWVSSQGRSGSTGHGNMSGRLNSFGRFSGSAAENISYGQWTARDVVLQLIIDDGIPSRGHRTNLFGASFGEIGIKAGYHRVYGTMTVMDFAGSYTGK
jgi:uncharacterized protein YkwD